MITGLVLLGVSGCHQADSSAHREVLRRGLGGEPATLDPAVLTDTFSHEVVRDLYEGLTAQAPSGAIIPGVASSWAVDSTGTKYTFELRSTARWSDGSPVIAQNFVDAWRRAIDPKTASPSADLLRTIAGATAIMDGHALPSGLGVSAEGNQRLVVHLEQPAPYFPALLSHAVTYPLYSVDRARTHDPARWVSNGAYILASWQPGTLVRLERNPMYWDKEHVAIPHVEYHVAVDDAVQARRYQAGELDLTDTIPITALPTLRRENAAEIHIAPFLATAYYALNLSRPPFADNIKLRQAFAMAIDRDRLIETLGFGQPAAYGLVPPGIWNYEPQSWEWKTLTTLDREAQARQLYTEAGYSPAKPLHVRLLYNSNPSIRAIAIVVASEWKSVLGVDCELDDEEYRVFLDSRHDKTRWEVARLGWFADYDDAGNFLDTLRSDSINNDSGYQNDEFDRLLDRAAHTPDPAARRAVLESAERTMLADYPIVPLYFFVSKRLIKPEVLGARINALNRVYSANLRLADP